MAAVNSLLFLLSTIAPYTELPINAPYPLTTWKNPSSLKDDEPGGTNATGAMCFTPWIYKGPMQCEENAHYERCGFICHEMCCPYECVLNCCVEGCFCDEGYVRGPEGTCITKEECPPTCDNYMDHSVPDTVTPIDLFPDKECPKNEWYTCSAHCQRRCEKSWWPCPGWCVPGCECMWPLVRARDGQCVFPDQCPYHSSAENQDIEECESDQEMSCYSHCEHNCTNYDQEIPCPVNCVIGCVCKEPKIRGPDGSCILPEHCPSSLLSTQDTECLENTEVCFKIEKEEHQNSPTSSFASSTPTACLQEKVVGPCGGYFERFFFNGLTGKCEKFIYGGCQGSSNNFQSEEDCHDVCENKFGNCSETEIYATCGTACERNCTTFHRKNHVCPDTSCIAGCFCKPGYIRGPNGQCIRPIECWFINPLSDPDIPFLNVGTFGKNIDSEYDRDSGEFICPKNEEYKICGTACPKNCTNYDKNIPCSHRCVAGCFCKAPMIRGSDEKCIYKEECPETSNKVQSLDVTCPENEEYDDCGTACPKNCDNPDKDVLCPYDCVSGCFCKYPMIRGPDGKCIHKEECSEIRRSLGSKALCPKDEVYLFCGSSCQKNCTNFDEHKPCISMCVQGCFCEEPRIRGPDGKCILVEDCPAKSSGAVLGPFLPELPPMPSIKCGKNAEFSLCSSLCPDNCNNYQTTRLCKHICFPGCKCKSGYVFSDEGTCINEEDCKTKTASDCTDLEYYDECGSVCQKDCVSYYNIGQDCKNKGCLKGCFCKPGLVRSPSDWKCVLPEKCQLLGLTAMEKKEHEAKN